MTWLELWLPDQTLIGGLFLDSDPHSSFLSSIPSQNSPISISNSNSTVKYTSYRRKNQFLSVSLSVKGEEGFVVECRNGGKGLKDELERKEELERKGEMERNIERNNREMERREKVKERGRGAVNTTKHLWSGAVAAMVSRTVVAPLERLKLEYMVRGEQSDLLPLVQKIFRTQGLRGFWKGNLVNILRTAPFKAVNFYAYDTYRKQLMRVSGKEEVTNFERFVAGAAAGITATVMCIPLDTIRTLMVAPGGEALGGVIGAFRHVIATEGFFSLYKGLVPSLISMAPSGAVFYGVYDILKAGYLHSPEGILRLSHMSQKRTQCSSEPRNAFDKLELGPMRTLLYGAVAGACAEAATYPFEVVRRQLQLQARGNRMSSVQTLLRIVETGGVPGLYAGLIPSLLQVLPSASISYFVYEIMKIVLKVE